MRLYVALVFSLIVAGCYSPQYRDCALMCPDGQSCPSGYDCKSGVCRLPDKEGPCDNGDDAGVDAVSRLPISAFYEAVVTATCERGARCKSYDDVATCLAFAASPSVQAQFDAFVLAEMQGKVEYHEDIAMQCLAAIAQMGCVRDEPFPPVCRGALTGNLEAAAICAFDSECMSGVCMKPNTCLNNPNCCTGTCVGSTPPGDKMLGQPCTAADRCLDSYCDLTAFMPVCTAYQPVNDTCDVAKNECPPGSTCRIDQPGMMTCEALVAPGGLCANSTDCRDLSNVCKAENGAPRVCVESGLTGATCSDPNSADCHQGLSCNGVTCMGYPGPGEPCFGNNACRVDAYCNGGNCVDRLPDGAQCDPVIPGGNCESFRCTSNVCEPYPVCT